MNEKLAAYLQYTPQVEAFFAEQDKVAFYAGLGQLARGGIEMLGRRASSLGSKALGWGGKQLARGQQMASALPGQLRALPGQMQNMATALPGQLRALPGQLQNRWTAATQLGLGNAAMGAARKAALPAAVGAVGYMAGRSGAQPPPPQRFQPGGFRQMGQYS